MTTLTLLRQAMTEFLTAQGIPALTAWPQGARSRREEPVAVVQIKEVEAAPAGFQNYLGQRYDSQRHLWTERWGQRVTVKFLLTLYSPRAAGEAGCRDLLDQVAAALLRGDGLRPGQRHVLGQAPGGLPGHPDGGPGGDRRDPGH